MVSTDCVMLSVGENLSHFTCPPYQSKPRIITTETGIFYHHLSGSRALRILSAARHKI